MNKTAIKNFAIWARNKLIADISYRAGLMGITADGIHKALPQSTGQTEFYDIGTAEPYAISEEAIRQREHLVELIRSKEKDSDYKTAYKYIIEEVAYTWFNRLIAVRFMEVNNYLPSHIRVLSSEYGKIEPDLVTTPFDADLDFTGKEQQTIIELKNDNELDEVFRLLFIKQCNALNEILPALFEKTDDYTELLLNLSVIDQDGVVYHLVHDIPEEDFDVDRGGQVEIIGWLYQYYNSELNDQVYDGNMSKSRIPKELVPAATTIYTPDWPIHYMVENSIGRIWIEGHPNDEALRKGWTYYLEESDQKEDVQNQLDLIREKYSRMNPEDIKVIDPCMGSGHILVYAFDILMQIYESVGYGQRDAARSILENNIYGLDIDDRAYQMAYFAIMMKARYYNRRILSGNYLPNLYSFHESNGIKREQLKYFGVGLSENEKKLATNQITELLDTFKDAKEYGSILIVKDYDWKLLNKYVSNVELTGQLNFDAIGLDETIIEIKQIIKLGICLSQRYQVVITNPPYLGSSRFSPKLDTYVKENYSDVKSDLCMVMLKAALSRLSSQDGFVSFITTSSWLSVISFAKLREYMLSKFSLCSLVDFGTELFEGKVGHNPIVAWINRNSEIDYKMCAIRLVEFCYSRRDEKEKEFFNPANVYYAKTEKFKELPDCPIAYWVSEPFIDAFKKDKLYDFAPTKQGIATADNNRFLRLWQEVSFENIAFNVSSHEDSRSLDKKWYPYNKGGSYRKWYGNRDYLLNWQHDGSELKAFDKAVIRNPANYFMAGCTWSDITLGGFSARISESGFINDSTGPMCFPSDELQLYTLGLLNSKPAKEFLKLLAPTFHFREGPVGKIPYVINNLQAINALVSECITISKAEWDSYETSWDFSGNPLVKNVQRNKLKNVSLSYVYDCWAIECAERFQRLKSLEEEINRMFIVSYNFQDEMKSEIDDKEISIRLSDCSTDMKLLLSYAVGCMVGRYSLDTDGIAYAGGNWNDSRYKSFIPDNDNVIPINDEEYFEDDIVSRLCSWLKVVFGEKTLEENLDYIASNLGNKGASSREKIRNYFLNDFFKEHCQMYTVSASGKRPIYWLFDSGKQNGFKALIYLHRYNADTIGNLRIDYLHRMQRIYESEIGRMQDMIDHSTNAREAGQATKRKDKLTKQLKECREYDEKLAHLALSRIELDLDDGVKVNYRKVQTANDGKFYEVLADSKNIMSKK